ncbi:hypothetical protein AAKU52_000182 [Pedobacter sp. CG_S7]|uniref:GIN domain-containing protein n=1 Tax=Pedobacter sp. CG_S7 TaxID=3143930 RepID=UPI003391E4E3
MKTSIKTALATALTAIILSSTAFTTFATDRIKSPTADNTISGVNMVKVTGNVNVYLIQGDKEAITVAAIESEGVNFSIKKQGNKLFIDGAGPERRTVYVYLKDLKRIHASNESMVKTKGNFDLDLLQVFLYDGARVNLNVSTKSLYTMVNDHAKLKLSGSAGQHILVKDKLAIIKTDKFMADKTQGSATVPSYAVNLVKKD